jgi:hypothetical protein
VGHESHPRGGFAAAPTGGIGGVFRHPPED